MRVIDFPMDDLTRKLNEAASIKHMKENYCDNYIGCKDRGLHVFCLEKGMVTAIMCKKCKEEKNVH